jgi:hypothetical protein
MAKHVNHYFPLALIDSFDEASYMWHWKNIKEGLALTSFKGIPGDRDDYVLDFLKIGNEEPKEYIREMVTKVFFEMYKSNDNINSADIKDIFCYPLIIEKWSENKQVFKPDNTFLDALVKTENIRITKSDIEHLPCYNFYLDLEDYNNTFNGAFVQINNLEHEIYISIYCMAKQDAWFSHYLHIMFNENGELKLDELKDIFSEEENKEKDIMNFDAETGRVTKSIIELENDLTTTQIYKMVLQLMLYMTSKEPDLKETEKTKHTYRKPVGEPKNVFREVQMFDVGVRYGRTIRTKLKEEKKKANIEKYQPKNEIGEIIERKRKSPRLHFRCAHWQRVWTGKGRTVPENRWIEPVFVGAGRQTDVIIHKVK